MESSRASCLMSALAEVAWADGVLRPEEARFFVDVVKQLGLTEDVAAVTYELVLTAQTVEGLDLRLLDRDDRRWVLGFGYLMSAVDGDVTATEIAVLQDLARRLGVPWVEAETLFQEAESLRPMVVRDRGGAR